LSFGKCPSIARQTNGQIVLAIAGLDLRIGYFHRRTIATLVERHTRYVSSDAKIERLKLLGADFTLNYTSTPDWGKKARELSGRGVDLVVEVGGIGTLNESIRATKIGGTIAFIGVLAGPAPAESRISLMVMQQQRLQGVTVGSVEDLQAMVDAIATNRMKPVIDRTFPFDQVKQAFSYLASGAHFGKVAISIG
jgi:NADPH:quinone reductase-like Zn-dependent oxidoreductase